MDTLLNVFLYFHKMHRCNHPCGQLIIAWIVWSYYHKTADYLLACESQQQADRYKQLRRNNEITHSGKI